ncbi:MAG: DinB family protein [Bacteroidia bacterium]
MADIDHIINCLECTPVILNTLLESIPQELYKVQRVNNKWSIHEQVCHLVDAQEILINRFKQFELEESPTIKTYDPPADRSSNHYLNLNMENELQRFPALRKSMTSMLKGFAPSYWDKTGKHVAFTPYSSKILLIHSLNVDYAHLFSIEQLGLTKEGLEEEILTIP